MGGYSGCWSSKARPSYVDQSLSDLIITHNIGVERTLPKAYVIREVSWHLSPPNWIKCNIDGSTTGAAGRNGCDESFRTYKGFIKGSFSYALGICFSLKAEIMGFILAVEKVHEFGWHNLWIESELCL